MLEIFCPKMDQIPRINVNQGSKEPFRTYQRWIKVEFKLETIAYGEIFDEIDRLKWIKISTAP